jgi:hypothetical protein
LGSPERDRTITEVTGRTRRLPERQESEVRVEAAVEDLADDDVIDIEEVPARAGSPAGAPTAATSEPDASPATSKRKPWLEEFASLTRDMERLMGRGRDIFTDRRGRRGPLDGLVHGNGRVGLQAQRVVPTGPVGPVAMSRIGGSGSGPGARYASSSASARATAARCSSARSARVVIAAKSTQLHVDAGDEQPHADGLRDVDTHHPPGD